MQGAADSDERETITKREKDVADETFVKNGVQEDTLLIPSLPISVAAPLIPARTSSGNFYFM